MQFGKRNWVFALGLLALGAMWYSVHPIGWSRNGFAEDRCFAELPRQIMSVHLRETGKPGFTTDSVMAPKGASLPYLNWAYERDWLGALFWSWDKDFPFFWLYYGASLLCYLTTGWILCRMGLRRNTAWAIATVVVLFNLPRQVRTWRSYEQVEHWIYVAFFLDAWLWQRFVREKRWSLKIEAWRALAGLAMLGGPGYYWPILILEWVVVRLCMAGYALAAKVSTETPKAREVLPAALLALPLVAIDLAWFPPLKQAVDRAGDVYNNLAWFANISYFVRPLWLDPLASLAGNSLSSVETPETVVTIGWLYWVPFFAGIVALKRSRTGLAPVLPFLILVTLGVLYATTNFEPFLIQRLLMSTVPLMRFFRVASRWGLFLPPLVAIGTILAWPELSARWRAPRSKAATAGLALFALLSLVELGWLFAPKRLSPPLDADTKAMLEEIRASAGATVLDLPFCVAGGNGVCTAAECPNYPASTTGLCLRQIHEKKVYGIYASRLVPSDCQLYNEPPYTRWFQAWSAQRCFSAPEWQELCGYLDQHAELAAILVYPDIWRAAGTTSCGAEFSRHLGEPLREGRIPAEPYYGGDASGMTRVVRYGAKCRK